jgi:hypothetical protein
MPITWHTEAAGRWAVMIYSDPFTVADFDRTLREILHHPIARLRRLLIDQRDIGAPDAAFVTQVVAHAERHREHMPGARVAIVAPADGVLAMARMTELLVAAREYPVAVRGFLSYDEAEAWLAESVVTNGA